MLNFLCSPVGLTEGHFWCIRKEIFKILHINLVVFARFSLRRNCQHQNWFWQTYTHALDNFTEIRQDITCGLSLI